MRDSRERVGGRKTGKGWWESQTGKEQGKGKGLQSVNERDEWDQTEDYTSVPLLSKKPNPQISGQFRLSE